MKVSMYELAVPTLSHALDNLARILEKAAAHCEAKKIDPAVLISSRLYPDMFPLGKQVQIAADAAKGGASRLAQVEQPVFEDNETTFAELAERCRKTVAYLKTIDAAKFEGCEDRTVTWKTRKGEKSLQGMPYLLTHVIPNLFFHATTAYGILRHNGVELGKGDFLGTR